MTKWGKLCSVAGTCLLAGCFHSGETVPVNLDFAHTNYGYINSGDYKAGSFFLWDREANTLSYLADLPGFDAPDHPRDKERDIASYSGGVSLGGGVQSPAIKAKADALIRSKSSFEIAYPNRVTYNRVYSRISDFLNSEQDQSSELLDEWGFKDAAQDPDQFYILVRDVTYGDGIKLLVDGEAKAGGGFSVPLKGYDVNIKLEGRGLQNITGTNTEVAFSVYVLRPVWQQKDGAQTAAFKVVRGIDISDLPELLRNVGRNS